MDVLAIAFFPVAAGAMIVRQKLLNKERVLWEFPHPSGANGHRVRLFKEAKERLRGRAATWAAKFRLAAG